MGSHKDPVTMKEIIRVPPLRGKEPCEKLVCNLAAENGVIGPPY